MNRPSEVACVHHWLLPPGGPVVQAYCKKCNSTRSFDTSVESRWTLSRRPQPKRQQ